MKRFLLTLTIAVVGYCSYAQTNTFPSSGNVGIGTTSPVSDLQVSGLTVLSNPGGTNYNENLRLPPSNAGFSSIALGAIAGTSGSGVGQWSFVRYPVTSNYLFGIRYGDSDYFNIVSNGSIGINTKTPQSLLHIYQNTPNSTGLILQGNTINSDNAQHYIAMTFDGDYGNATGNYSQIRSYSNLYSNWGSQLAFFTTQVGVANTVAERMRIDWYGNVGIGTSAPDAKLSVNGTIHTKEVKVDLTGWPDYVFKPIYKLPSLSEIKTYINQYQHLPDMPSEQEVAKNGINLGEIVKVQTKKIEELTLYLIDKENQVNDQTIQLSEQKKEIELLKKGQDELKAALAKLTDSK
ncbi:hypothetical protein [Mucilaginibacter jinjuensis]|uniref:Peptidase S74 domain-containing protein n=1 Tax=Mucilaginibacter jinjuensis TaxID=1176721 RepID=A0ABY7TDH4_9SPHI|nr:hypothetical protein [Mucilaginibacter jinjuensis]WCT13677.1 hypothetical protein PQO05_06975 [Mucilaginibacter jinjuensis]